MNNPPFFSIIVPIYNMAEYLRECVESVINQTFDDWELILIDDGSEDSSPEICDFYADMDKRIKTIHKENGGEFSARLAGINIANGKYVTGVDPDDYYDLDYLQTIKLEIDKCESDCIMWSFSLCGERHGYVPLDKEIIKDYSGPDYLLMVIQTTLHSFCSKAIRLDVLRQTDFSEIPSVRMSEDYIMIIPTLCNIKNARVIEYYGYYYRIRSESASNSVSYEKLMDMCKVSEYGIKVMHIHHFDSDEYIKGEASAFIRSIVPRMWKGIREKTITKQDLREIWKNEILANSLTMIDADYWEKYRLQELINLIN